MHNPIKTGESFGCHGASTQAVDPGTGAVKRILKLPRSGDPQDRFMHPPFGRITYGVVYILGRGPRLHAIHVAAAE